MDIQISSYYGFYSWCYILKCVMRSVPKTGYERRDPPTLKNNSYKKMFNICVKNIPEEVTHLIVSYGKYKFYIQLHYDQCEVDDMVFHDDTDGDDVTVEYIREDKFNVSLEKYTIKIPPLSIKGDEEHCSICLGNIDTSVCEILQCYHAFHTKCLWTYCEKSGYLIRKPSVCDKCEHGDTCSAGHNIFNKIICPMCRQSSG